MGTRECSCGRGTRQQSNIGSPSLASHPPRVRLPSAFAHAASRLGSLPGEPAAVGGVGAGRDASSRACVRTMNWASRFDRLRVRPRRTATFMARVKNSDGPQPSGCFNILTTLVGKPLFVFENKASVYRTLGAGLRILLPRATFSITRPGTFSLASHFSWFET
jgi:hypothetical protein